MDIGVELGSVAAVPDKVTCCLQALLCIPTPLSVHQCKQLVLQQIYLFFVNITLKKNNTKVDEKALAG